MPRHEDRKQDDYRSRKHRKHDHHEDRHESKRIKIEEDFDRRQEELSRRRRDDRPQRDDRERRNYSRQHRDTNDERIRHDANQPRDERRGHDDDQPRDDRRRHDDDQPRDDRRRHDDDQPRDDRRRHDDHQLRGDRRRHDDNRQRDRQIRERDIKIEDAFKNSGDEVEKEEKEKPNLGLSGALTEDTNTYRGVVIKYNEPAEARIPKKRWRLYPFKGSEALKTLHLHRQSAFLLGRLRRIVDIPVDHPSCSKQHAVLQFRRMDVDVDGVLRRRVKPYVIDLGSANGTYVNNERIEAQRYVELKEQDVLKFGFSSREYVLLHDRSDTADMQSGSEEGEED